MPALPAGDEATSALSAQPKLAWQTDVGFGITAPLVVRGPALFATTTNRTVVAVNVENGRRYWLQRFDGAISTGVAVTEGRVFFATEDMRGEAWALDAVRGRRMWKRRIGSARVRPLISGEHVIFGVQDGSLYALRRSDGEVAWRTRLAGSIALNPILSGQTILTGTTTDSIYALDRADGRVLRRAALPGTPTAPAQVAGNALVLPTNEGGLVTIDLATLDVLARVPLSAPVFAQPQVLGGTVYVLDRDGVVWRLGRGLERVVDLGSAAREAFLAVDNQLVAGLLDGTVRGIDTSGKTLWQYKGERSAAAPIAAAGGALYVSLLNGELLKLQ